MHYSPYLFLSKEVFLSFPGMLRASRNIWRREPYPNKMPVAAPPFLPFCLAELALQTRLSPSGHSTSALCRSKSCPLVPSTFPPAASPSSPPLPSPTHLSYQLTPAVAAAQTKATLFHLLLWFFLPVLRMEEHFLLPGRRGNWLCVVMDTVPSFLCSDRPCFAIVSF